MTLEYEWAILGATIFGVFVAIRRGLPASVREHVAAKLLLSWLPFVVGAVAGVVLWGTPERGAFRAALYGTSSALFSKLLWEGLEAGVRSLRTVLPAWVAKMFGVSLDKK
jgi:uncharacterized membrane protein YdcZ (DUF606 family)